MGRPGTQVGDIDTGLSDKDGKPFRLPLGSIFGYTRALRSTGLKAVIEGKRADLPPAQILDNVVKDVANTVISPMAGPPVRFASVALTGKAPYIGSPQMTPVVGPNQSQLVENVKHAALDISPAVSSVAGKLGGETWNEALKKQFPRFVPVASQSNLTEENKARIISASKLNLFIDNLASRARKKPMDERIEFIANEIEKADLDPAQRGKAWKAIKGKIKYQ